ncbi:hypothetical protein, partial [Ralstonia mannitolilytica]
STVRVILNSALNTEILTLPYGLPQEFITAALPAAERHGRARDPHAQGAMHASYRFETLQDASRALGD